MDIVNLFFYLGLRGFNLFYLDLLNPVFNLDRVIPFSPELGVFSLQIGLVESIFLSWIRYIKFSSLVC